MPAYDPRSFTGRLYGAEFDYVAQPSRTIRGVVRDRDSKEPLSNVVVGAYQYSGSLLDISV